MIKLAQIGFLALTALFLTLTVYYYPIQSICVAMLAICVAAGMLNAGNAVGLASGVGCLGFFIFIFGGLYGLAYLFFCIGGSCA